MYSTLPEFDGDYESGINSVRNEREAQIHDDMHQGAIGYYNAKKAFFDDLFENRFELTTQ